VVVDGKGNDIPDDDFIHLSSNSDMDKICDGVIWPKTRL